MNELKNTAGILTVIVITSLMLCMTSAQPAWSVSLKAVPADKCGIGILPFDSGSAGPFSYLAPAIESMVGSRLTSPERISVISPQELRGFLDVETTMITDEDKKRAARELGLSYFVTGKVSQRGENAQVDLILLRVDSAIPAVSSHIAPTSLDAISPGVEDFCLQATDAVLRGAGSALSEEGKGEEQHPPMSEQPVEEKPAPDMEVSASRMHPARLIKRPFEGTPAAAGAEGHENRQRTEAIVKGAEDDELDLAPFPPPPDDSIPIGTSAPSEVEQKKASTPTEKDLESSSPLRLPEPPDQEERGNGWLSWILGPWGKEGRNNGQSGQEHSAPAKPASKELQTSPPASKDEHPPSADTGPIWQWY
jgi:TolB-like protein